VCSFEVGRPYQALLSLRFIALVWMMVAKRVLTEILQGLREFESVLRSGPVASQGLCVNILRFGEAPVSRVAAWRFGRNSGPQSQTGFEPVI
jgi:hypothetical protein